MRVYERALYASIDSIKSMLDDEAVQAYVQNDSIIVDVSESELRFTLDEFRTKVFPAFVDKNNCLYENYIPPIDVFETLTTNGDSTMRQQATRTDLYEEVWNEPISKLCRKYDISDVGLKKVLDRHGIPRPPVGYRAMKSKNQERHHRALPELSTGQSENIVFEGFSSHLSPGCANHKLVLKANAFEHVQSKRLPSELSHILSELRSQRTDKYGVVKSTGVRVAKKRIAEAKLALGHLEQLTTLLGWRLRVTTQIKLSTDGNSYRIELNERVKRSDNPKYGKYQQGGHYSEWAEKWLYTPTGALTLSFDNKKFRITDDVIHDCGKLVEYLLKTD